MATAKSVTVSIDKLSPSTPSLCIPRVFPNITWQRVKDALEDVGLGEIDRVDMVHKKNEKGESFKRVFVHFKKWATTPEATAAREMVLGGDMFQVTYDDPWFWKIGMSHAEKPERRTGGPKKAQHKGKARPQLSIRTTPKKTTHKTAPKKSNPDADLRAMIEEQRRELETLRAALAQTVAPTTPEYQPETPNEGPPELIRNGAGGDAVEFGTKDHIARELETEFEEAA